MFFAYLTIVPSLALFLVRVETEFYTKYKAYFGGIVNKEPLHAIEERKRSLIDTLRRSLGSVIIYQGAFTIAVIVLIPYLLDVLEVSRVHVPLFRIAAIAAVFHVLLLVLMVILLYFDFRKPVMWLSFTFMTTNGLFSWITTYYPQWYGWGYMVAAFVSLIVGLMLLSVLLRDLEYLTFARQPISQQKVVVK